MLPSDVGTTQTHGLAVGATYWIDWHERPYLILECNRIL